MDNVDISNAPNFRAWSRDAVDKAALVYYLHILELEKRTGASGTEARVCQDIATRQAFGIRKYGTTIAENPLTQKQWMQHAYEEALDLAVYLKRLIELANDT